MKLCIRCGCVLTADNWPARQRTNHVNKCADCLRTEKRDYGRQWHRDNRARSRERSLRYKHRLAVENPVKARAKAAYNDARKRALRCGMAFDLTPDYVLSIFNATEKCPYFDWRLTHAPNKANTLASLDRIDSAKGYTVGNVRVVSYLANLMKSSATPEELRRFASGVLRLTAAGG